MKLDSTKVVSTAQCLKKKTNDMQQILFSHQSTNVKGLQRIESALIKASPQKENENILSIQNILQLSDVIT